MRLKSKNMLLSANICIEKLDMQTLHKIEQLVQRSKLMQNSAETAEVQWQNQQQ